MPLQPPASITNLPTPPSSADPANFDARGDAFLGALPTMQAEFNIENAKVYNNAELTLAAATQVEGDASEVATNKGLTEGYKNTAEAAAAAAQASAGLPALTAIGDVLMVKGTGGTPDGVEWGPADDIPAIANKLNKDNGVATRLLTPYIDHGTIAAAGTENINAALATVHRIQAAGNLTLTFSNLPTGLFSGDIELLCVNFGGKTINWPAGNWIKADGSYAAAVGNSGVTWQVSGTDRVLVMIDNGAITYKVMR